MIMKTVKSYLSPERMNVYASWAVSQMSHYHMIDRNTQVESVRLLRGANKQGQN